MNKGMVLAIRVGLGLLGGFVLQRIFYPQGGWPLALILAVLVVVAAYLSEVWRAKKLNKDQGGGKSS